MTHWYFNSAWLTPETTIMTCLARCAHWYNSGRTIMAVTTAFWFGNKSYSTRGTDGWYCKPYQEPITKEVTEPRGGPTTPVFAAWRWHQTAPSLFLFISSDIKCGSQHLPEKSLFIVDSSWCRDSQLVTMEWSACAFPLLTTQKLRQKECKSRRFGVKRYLLDMAWPLDSNSCIPGYLHNAHTRLGLPLFHYALVWGSWAHLELRD